MQGYIALHRKILEWEWFKEPNHFLVFSYLLLMAQHKDTNLKGIEIPKGSLLTSVKSICDHTGLTTQTVRTILKRLNLTNELTIKTTSKHSIITIVKWDDYQCNNNVSNKQLTNGQQTTNKQLTTYNNVNNVNNGKNVKTLSNVSPRVNQVLEDWNEVFGGNESPIRPVRYLTEEHKILINASMKENSCLREIGSWKFYFQKIKSIDFLNGLGPSNWVADFEWCINKKNIQKVISRKYENNSNVSHAIRLLDSNPF
jgi:hypothetical protein